MKRRHYRFLFVITGVYLLFELAFNARLLDVVGSTMDEELVDEIEFFGRLISGCALALVFIPKVLKRAVQQRRARWATGARMAAVTVLCCLASYAIQEGILKTITMTSSAEARRAAATMVLVTGAVHSNDIVLAGISSDDIEMGSPEAKTFLALLPALALNTDNLEEKTEREVRILVRRNVDDEIGGSEDFFNEVYLPSEQDIKKSYNRYFEAADVYSNELSKIPAKQDEAYRDYRNELGRYSPSTLPRRSYGRVRNQVRSNGIRVPYDWDPRDRSGFYDAVERRAMSRIRPEYTNAMRENFGAVLPHEYTFAEFQKDETIQSRWLRETGLEDAEVVLQADLSYQAFQDRIYDPWVDGITGAEVKKTLAPVEEFEAGGASEQVGLDAIRIAYVPLVAFIFSCIGALVHFFKTIWFGLLAAFNRAALAAPLLIGAIAGVIGGVVMPQMGTTNSVSSSVLYTKLEEETREKVGMGLPEVMRGLVQLQPLFYPASEAVRTKVLFGIEYRFPRDEAAF